MHDINDTSPPSTSGGAPSNNIPAPANKPESAPTPKSGTMASDKEQVRSNSMPTPSSIATVEHSSNPESAHVRLNSTPTPSSIATVEHSSNPESAPTPQSTPEASSKDPVPSNDAPTLNSNTDPNTFVQARATSDSASQTPPDEGTAPQNIRRRSPFQPSKSKYNLAIALSGKTTAGPSSSIAADTGVTPAQPSAHTAPRPSTPIIAPSSPAPRPATQSITPSSPPPRPATPIGAPSSTTCPPPATAPSPAPPSPHYTPPAKSRRSAAPLRALSVVPPSPDYTPHSGTPVVTPTSRSQANTTDVPTSLADGNNSFIENPADLLAVPRLPAPRPSRPEAIAGPSYSTTNGAGPSSQRRYQPPPSHENRTANPASYGHNAAVVSYAIAENLAAPSQHGPGRTPSFIAPWAFVDRVEPRELSERQPRKRARENGTVLISRLLNGQHDWDRNTVQHMDFHRFVTSPEVFNRRDVQRFRMLAQRDLHSAMEIWSRRRQSRHWFQIPHTLLCDRTFARDEIECYYLEAVDAALRHPDRLEDASQYPFAAHPLWPRWWTAFRYRQHWNRESWLRVHLDTMVPYDDPEVQHWDLQTLREEYPRVPHLFKMLDIPVALPILWYFHYEILHGVDRERAARLDSFVCPELLCSAIASWFNEMLKGDRMYIFTEEAIVTLENRCGHIPIVQDVHTCDILNLMRYARTVPEEYWNEIWFADKELPASYFVDSRRGRVDLRFAENGGRVCKVTTKSRRVYDDLRQARRIELRNSSCLQLHIHSNELEMVPGLMDLATEGQWLNRGSTSMYNLLYDMVEKIRDVSNENYMLRSQTAPRNTQPDTNIAQVVNDGNDDDPDIVEIVEGPAL